MEIRKDAWGKLHQASQSKDSRLFWQTVNEGYFCDAQNSSIDAMIMPETWVKHFAGLYGNSTDLCCGIDPQHVVSLLQAPTLDEVNRRFARL